MSNQKHETIKNWLKEYFREFGEYVGTFEELAQLTDSSAYLVKKAISELEEESFLTAESKRGKGLVVKFIKGQDETESLEENEQRKISVSEEKKEKRRKKTSLQDEVLTSLLGKGITVFLISGTRLEGSLIDFDNFTLSMTAPKGRSLVYKHSIATIIYE